MIGKFRLPIFRRSRPAIPDIDPGHLVDVYVYLQGRPPLVFSCHRDNPVLAELLDALARLRESRAVDGEEFFLELEDETVRFPIRRLIAVEVDRERSGAGVHGDTPGTGFGGSCPPAAGSSPGGRPVAVLVLGCLLPRYETCLDVIERTWAARRFADIDVYCVFGDQFDAGKVSANSVERYIGRDATSLHSFQARCAGNVIVCGCADTIIRQKDCLLRKRLIAFDYLAGTGRYDFIYTVCASSYVDQANLRTYIESVDDNMLFHGPVSVCGISGLPFISGASMLFSIDMIRRLVADMHGIIEYNEGKYADDVALGSWIARHYSDTPQERIIDNIRARKRATGDNTFVLPYSRGMVNYVSADPARQVPVENTYHYHFDAGRIGQMAEFHRRFFEQAGQTTEHR